MKVLFFFLALFGLGFWWENKQIQSQQVVRSFPITSEKTFVFIVYAKNDALWIEKSLRSIFEQDYDSYRVLWINDGSTDDSFFKAKQFVTAQNQDAHVFFVHHPTERGFSFCLHDALQYVDDQEIVLPIRAHDFLSHSGALSKLNAVYQDPDIWEVRSPSLLFPSYEDGEEGLHSFYAALLKEIPFHEWQEGSYLKSLAMIAQGRSKKIPDILALSNLAAP